MVLAFKCDARVLLQVMGSTTHIYHQFNSKLVKIPFTAGVGSCIGVIGATFFQVVLVIYLLIVTCRDTEGCSCGSRLWTVVTFAFQIIAALLGVILSILPGRSPFSLFVYVC